ncbi:alpha-tectorin-like [Branchiostoma floridae x Branchiostoma belcheri]
MLFSPDRAICQAFADPHFISFDGTLHHYQGHCTYTLAKTCPTSITTDLPSFDVEVKLEPRSNPRVTWVREVCVTVFDRTIVFKKNKVVLVEGLFVLLPANPHPEVRVRQVGRYVTMEADFGLRVSFDGVHRVQVVLPSTYTGATCGICGNYNRDTADDYLTPDGILAGNVIDFGDSWRVPKEGEMYLPRKTGSP